VPFTFLTKGQTKVRSGPPEHPRLARNPRRKLCRWLPSPAPPMDFLSEPTVPGSARVSRLGAGWMDVASLKLGTRAAR